MRIEAPDVLVLMFTVCAELVLHIVVRKSPYPLRIMTRMDERKIRPVACMKAAAEAGLAPRVLYSNAAEGIAIIDWIEPVRFRTARPTLEK
jgi:hypothetical protein